MTSGLASSASWAVLFALSFLNRWQASVEIQYEPDGKIKKKNVFKYSDGLRSERQTFDKNGALISQRKYVYEFNK